MVPTSFDESNMVLNRPPDMTDEQCGPLSVWVGNVTGPVGDVQPTVVSCYKLTADELEEIRRTGRIWLGVLGNTMPPVWLTTHSPFQPTNPNP